MSDSIMPKAATVWSVIWPALLIGATWLFTGVAGKSPVPLAALGLGAIVCVALEPRWIPMVVIHLSAFALLLEFPVPTRFAVIGVVVLLALGLIAVKAANLDRKLGWAFALVISSLLLTTLSGSGGSAEGWSEWIVRVLNLNPSQADMVVVGIRKVIHFGFFGWLATCAFCCAPGKGWKRLVLGLVWVFGHGGYDELRQATTPGRTGSASDFAIDCLGAVTLLAILGYGELKRP